MVASAARVHLESGHPGSDICTDFPSSALARIAARDSCSERQRART